MLWLARLSPDFGEMLTLASVLILMFVIHSLFSEDIDDDDDPSSGLMQPIYAPNSWPHFCLH